MNARLLRLHLRCRQTGYALLGLIGTAVAVRASHHWTSGTGLFPHLVLLLLGACSATAIATGTASPWREVEQTASSLLPVLRLTHLLTLTGAATAATAVAGLSATYGVSGTALLRNLAGLTGIALLTAAGLGAHLSWTVPLGYVLYCSGELDLGVTNLWTWPTLPASDRTATTIALTLLAAGVATVSLVGAQDRRTDRT